MIVYNEYATADDPNVLSGTDLQTAPSPGIVKVYVASTQMDTTMTFTVPPRVVARNIPVNVKTVANVDLSTDIPYIVAVNGGEQLILAIDEVTAATIAISVLFIPREEM